MGQVVLGVMLGCKLTAKLGKLCDDEEGKGSLLEHWNDAQVHGTEIEADEDYTVIGAWVACSHGYDKNVPDLDKPIALADLEKGKALKAARKAWDRFAKWADTQGIKLPPPQLYLAPTEVA
jgi:hypothetical protein